MSNPEAGIHGLHAGFLASAARFPDRPALEVEGRSLSYRELRDLSAGLAGALVRFRPAGQSPRVGILANRSLPVYLGLLGTLMAGRAIVPLNPGFPVERTRQMIELAELDALVLDARGEQLLEPLLQAAPGPMLMLLPHRQDASDLRQRWPRHCFVTAADMALPQDGCPAAVEPDHLAYLFFTSGSTGTPKGVGVLHRNVLRFVAMSVERYAACGLGETDRFSQFYDITFDSSMFDLYVCWALGACLCCPSQAEWVNPNKFIVDKGLTVIDIVPSTGHALSRADGWRPGRFEGLRLCRFGGEALAAELAVKLAAAAPRAIVENVYGPTECTVDAAYYRWERGRSEAACRHGIVPIGHAGAGVTLLIVDDGLQAVAPGQAGELLIGGEQVTPGYWKDPEKTARSFVRLEGRAGVFYRTGDLVSQEAPDGPLLFLGRMDHQVKISGVRIELGEIEQAIRDASGCGEVVAAGWPLTPSGAAGIVAFVVGAAVDKPAVLRRLKAMLPSVMVPRELHLRPAFPLNANGKTDRKALLASLGEPAAPAPCHTQPGAAHPTQTP